MTEINASDWEAFLSHHPDAHLLQTPEWGALKSNFGWQAHYVQVGQAGAQILFRRLPLGFRVGYIPEGPIGQNWTVLLPNLDRLCRQQRAVFLKIEPDAWEPAEFGLPAEMERFGQPSRTIQPARTIAIDLRGNEEDWLARMKQKTRYNIRLAEKKEVVVTQSDDIQAFYQLMSVTGQRDGFGVHSLDYYRQAYELFAPKQACALLLAHYNDRLLAGLLVFRRGSRAWYLYGASNEEERNRMPAYLLQFEAMRWAAQRGCTWYDLWGVPDADEETLEAGFSSRSDGLWGVYRFKRGFGGDLKRSVGAWDRVYNRPLYALYRWALARRDAEGG